MNVLFILADQHAREFSGCYGGRTRTPHLDALAARGMRFTGAYCASPLCAPGRASLFTGQYVHEIGVWDNTLGYDGRAGGWPGHLARHGVAFTSIGRLDFQRGAPLGIEESRLPSYRGSPDVVALYRTASPVERRAFHFEYYDIRPAKPGSRFPASVGADDPDDRDVTNEAIDWLRRDRPHDRPWVLYVGYSNPHPKWHPQPAIFDRYLHNPPALKAKYLQPIEDLHPADQRNSISTCAYTNRDEAELHRMHAAYHAVVEEFDAEVGKLLRTLDDEGIVDDTLVIYSSDHGESARAHGNLAKCSMYEESVGVPLIVAGPGVRRGRVEPAPVSHLDLFPTIARATGAPPAPDRDGWALQPLLTSNAGAFPRPFVFAEYHANHSSSALFMIRHGDWKFVEHLHESPSLFNLAQDPDEMHDLARYDADSEAVRARIGEMRRMLHSVRDPERVDAAAKRDQAELRERLLADATLEEAIYLRGYDRNCEQLIPWDWEVFRELYR